MKIQLCTVCRPAFFTACGVRNLTPPTPYVNPVRNLSFFLHIAHSRISNGVKRITHSIIGQAIEQLDGSLSVNRPNFVMVEVYAAVAH
jgi:hypothetical protein